MKMLIIALSFLSSLSVFSQDCKVYGISDSPQEMSCKFRKGFKRFEMKLSCVRGEYFFKGTFVPEGTKVSGTHASTDDGSVVLMFYNDFLRFEVSEGLIVKNRAVLELDSEIYFGSCRF
jgi:hypothetical protein